MLTSVPIQREAAYFAVNPSNQISYLSFVVPVLPPACVPLTAAGVFVKIRDCTCFVQTISADIGFVKNYGWARTAFSVSAHSSIIQQFSQIHKVCLKQAYLYYRFFLPGVLQNRFPAGKAVSSVGE